MRFTGSVPERFEREYGCSVSEWMQWLRVAVGEQPLLFDSTGTSDGCARVALSSSALLLLDWCSLEPRRIALLQINRLRVRFEFYSATESQREAFMRHFDLAMQRGGG